MDKIIETDLSEFKKQIYTKQNTNDQGKYGVISEKFMSYLMYERLYLMERENVLWEILNANKNFTNVNNESIAEVDLSNQLNETQNSRIKKLMETNFGDRLIKDSNYDASDVEDCYLEYAKSKYAGRYFFYFSMLRKLSEYIFHSVNKEYKKYNVENIKKVKAEIKRNEETIGQLTAQVNDVTLAISVITSDMLALQNKNDQKSIDKSKQLNSELIVKNMLLTATNSKISNLNTKNLDLQRILEEPLTKFYSEHKDEIETVKKEIGDIREGWKRQYQKFIFAYLLEHPERISNLQTIIEKHWTSKTAIAFSEFLIKRSDHDNFSHACLEFDNLLKSRNWFLVSSSRQSKSNLYEKYKDEITTFDPTKRTLINSLLCENDSKQTLKYKLVGKATCIFYWCLGITLVIGLGPIFLCCTVGALLAGVCIMLAILFICIASFSVARSLWWFAEFCFSGESYSYPTWMFTTLYPSTAFLTILYISLAVLAIATIFLVYKKIQYYYFEKSLKRPPEDKDLDKKLNQDISKESDIYSSINHEPLISDLNSSVEVSNNVKNK